MTRKEIKKMVLCELCRIQMSRQKREGGKNNEEQTAKVQQQCGKPKVPLCLSQFHFCFFLTGISMNTIVGLGSQVPQADEALASGGEQNLRLRVREPAAKSTTQMNRTQFNQFKA